MLLALNDCYDQSSYIKILEDLSIYDKHVDTMKNVVEQLEHLEFNATMDHQENPQNIQQNWKTSTRLYLTFPTNKEVNIGVQWPLMHDQQDPQLPVLALKPNRLSFSMTTADLRIWKDA